MKKIIYFLLFTSLFISCKKEKKGNVIYNIKFTTQEVSFKTNLLQKSMTDYDTLYTQFGDYITSLTPTKFNSSVWTIGYTDRVGWQDCNALQYIEQNGDILPYSDPLRIVDFSSNATVSFNPVIYGDIDEDHNTFATPEVDFIYFYFIPFYLYQEVELPSQYQSVIIDMFPTSMDPHPAVFEGNILKVQQYQMINTIFPNAKQNGGLYFIFGNCDSSYVVNENGEYVGLSSDCPIAEAKDDLTIRSNNYVNMIFNSPYNGETVTMNGTLSFNTINLIQVYKGADNIAYTSDDIFVYAPHFWDRLYSRLDISVSE
jgi:hypothetical protein